MSYTEMQSEIKRIQALLIESKSKYQRKDLYKYLKRLKRELGDYERFKARDTK